MSHQPITVSPIHFVPAAFLEDLGRLVATWAHVESKFHVIYLHLTDQRAEFEIDDPALRSLGEAFKRRVRGLREKVAASLYTTEQKARINSLLDRLTTVHNARDDLAHAVISAGPMEGGEPMNMSPDSVTAIFKSFRNQKDHEWTEVTRSYLQETTQRMNVLFWDLARAWQDLPKGLARGP